MWQILKCSSRALEVEHKPLIFEEWAYSYDVGLLTLILRKFRLKGNAMPRAQVSDVKSMMMHSKQC